MDKPIPDGYLKIWFNQSISPRNDVRQSVNEFKDIRSWEETTIGLVIWHKEGTHGSRTIYPWTAIVAYELICNDSSYHKAVIEYHQEHDEHEVEHIEGNPFTAEPGYMICKDKECEWSSRLEELVSEGHYDG